MSALLAILAISRLVLRSATIGLQGSTILPHFDYAAMDLMI
jgi:hypothetical protein